MGRPLVPSRPREGERCFTNGESTPGHVNRGLAELDGKTLDLGRVSDASQMVKQHLRAQMGNAGDRCGILHEDGMAPLHRWWRRFADRATLLFKGRIFNDRQNANIAIVNQTTNISVHLGATPKQVQLFLT